MNPTNLTIFSGILLIVILVAVAWWFRGRSARHHAASGHTGGGCCEGNDAKLGDEQHDEHQHAPQDS